MLNNHTYYSFKYGTLSHTRLLEALREGGYEVAAITDINNTSGVFDFVRLAPDYGVRPLAGIDFRNGSEQLYVGIARNTDGFRELNSFLTPFLHEKKDLPREAPVLENCYFIYPFTRANRYLRDNEFVGLGLADVAQLPLTPWAHRTEKLVVLNTFTYLNKRDFNAHRLLRAIDKNVLLSKLPPEEQASEDHILWTKERMRRHLGEYWRIWENTRELAASCTFDFELGKFRNKQLFLASADEDDALLQRLVEKGMKYRYPNPTTEVTERIAKEIALIKSKRFTSYFLINWDIVRYARERNFFYVGRGSGANSVVAYCLRITDVDPIDLDLYFERFINEARENPPDFDIDFSWKDRDEIIAYVFQRHGKEHVSLLGTYNTFQRKAALRELGKVFGLPKAEIDDLIIYQGRRPPPSKLVELVYTYSELIHGFPAHLSIHAGGMLISQEPIFSYSPTELPPKGFPVVQFSMLEAEDIGLYKFDILSQRGLGHIKDTVDIVKDNCGVEIDIHDIKAFKEDPKVKRLLSTGRTMGCFYVESPAMRMLLNKLQTNDYIGLVAASSIIRPGVSSSGMMREYIKRHREPERREYIHPKIGELMKETYGVMVYQEDVIKVAHYFAGLTLTEADVLRRGMSGKYRNRTDFNVIKDKFFSNCRRFGYDDAVTAEVWRQIESFGNYAFSKGHSASYAVESYQSLFLKAHYPREFMVGVINNFGGFYRTEHYVQESRMAGAVVEGPCVNTSEYLSSINGHTVTLGLIHLKSLEYKISSEIVAQRERYGTFNDLDHFLSRVSISLEQLIILIRMNAFRFTGKSRQALLWDAHFMLHKDKKSNPEAELFEIKKKKFELPPLEYDALEQAIDEIELLGFALCSPYELLAKEPNLKLRARHLAHLHGKTVFIMGYYVTHKVTKTKQGLRMNFGTFLDRDGYFFDTTHFPQVAAKFPFRGAGVYGIKGKVAVEFDYPSVEVIAMKKLPLKEVNETEVVKKKVVKRGELNL
jgi:DNA-directed DNA polymerase III PolC